MGCSGEYTTGAWFTLRDRPGLSERDQGKRGPSGESNAPPIESLPPGALEGVLMVESREGKGAGQAPTKVDGNRSPHEVCAGRLTRNAKNSQATDSRVLGGHPPRFHLQSIFGRGVKLPSPLQLLWKRGNCDARKSDKI